MPRKTYGFWSTVLWSRALTFAQPHGNAFWVGLREHNYIAYSSATTKKNAKKNEHSSSVNF